MLSSTCSWGPSKWKSPALPWLSIGHFHSAPATGTHWNVDRSDNIVLIFAYCWQTSPVFATAGIIIIDIIIDTDNKIETTCYHNRPASNGQHLSGKLTRRHWKDASQGKTFAVPIIQVIDFRQGTVPFQNNCPVFFWVTNSPRVICETCRLCRPRKTLQGRGFQGPPGGMLL